MKIITDERLILQNLKNIRALFLFQNLGIIGILAYDFITKGMDGMNDNPLWYLLIMTTVVSAYLSMSIGVDHEEGRTSPQKSLGISFTVVVVISALLGIVTGMSDGSSVVDGTVVAAVIFVCGLSPALYVYWIRKRRMEDE